MIPITRLLYKLDMKLNKLASNEHQSIHDVDKILALNEAQLKLIKQKANLLDSTKVIYNEFAVLIIPSEKLTAVNTNDEYKSYYVDLDELSQEYYLFLEAVALCTKENCKDRAVYLNRLIKHGDLYTANANEHTKPSFEYQETFGIISSGKLYIYTDGTFEVNDVYITYARYPQKVNIAGYIDFDGTPSFDQDCELYNELEDELLNLTVIELAKNTENIPLVQLNQQNNKQ